MTAPVLPAITPMPLQGSASEATSVVPLSADSADMAKDTRFSNLLSRRMRLDADADADAANADAFALVLPNPHDAAQTALAHAALDPADLNAHILAQTRLLFQENTQSDAPIAAADPAQTALASHLSGARRDPGSAGRAAPRTTTADASLLDADHPEGLHSIGSIDGIGAVDGTINMRKPAHTSPDGLNGVGKTRTGTASLSAQTASTPSHAGSVGSVDATSAADPLLAHMREAIQTPADRTIDATAAHGNDKLASPLLPLVQFAAGHTANPPASVSAAGTGAIALPLHHPQWPQALGQHVLHLSHANAQSPQVAQLRLDPPELGPLHIAIELHQNVAHAAFASAHAPVRLAVENALPQLQEQLAHAGISLGQTSVSDHGAPRQEFAAHDAVPLPVAHAAAPKAPQTTHTASTAVHTRRAHAFIDTFA